VELGPEYPVEPFLAYLREEVYTADAAWRETVAEEQPETAETRLFLPTGRATSVALALYDLDRETRRAVRLVESEFRTDTASEDASVWRTFRPIPVSEGGFVLSRAEFRSADLILDAFGAVAAFLLSNPVQLTLTVKELLGWSGEMAVRVKRRFDPEQEVVSSTGAFRVQASRRGVSISEVPEGTHVSVEHRMTDGTTTTIHIDRS
jgi:hypothetical protein